MATKKPKPAGPKPPARKPPAKDSVAAQLPAPSASDAKAAKAKFTQGVIKRGEAVPAGQPLPPGATHEIVGKTEDGTPVLKRKRFSLS